MEFDMSKLYIVDDDILTSDLLSTATEDLFSSTSIFNSSRAFIEQRSLLKSNDIIILDLMMPDIDGIEVLRALAEANCSASVILISGYDSSVLHSAERLAHDYGIKLKGNFSKPISLQALTRLITTILFDSNIEILKNYATNQLSAAPCKKNANAYTPSVQELQNAIINNEFTLHYQPQLKMKTKELYGVEALARWQHPTQGLLFPNSFIEMAESNGLIGELTKEITEIALKQSHQWLKQGYKIQLSINISAQNITSLTLPEQLTELINHYQVPPSMLVLEITETALMGNLTLSLDILTRLRLKGFFLSIDDFGTGFSSLSQLHKIPFTELKIDRSFVSDMAKDEESLAIVETCIMLGHKLNMKVVAEGIEEQATWDLLIDLNCDVAQGFLISKPIPAEMLSDWINNYLNTSNVG